MTNSEAVSMLMNSQYYNQGYKQGVSDVLDKIRAEIEQDAFKDVNGSKYIFVDRVNQIIDKYKSEGSNKE